MGEIEPRLMSVVVSPQADCLERIDIGLLGDLKLRSVAVERNEPREVRVRLEGLLPVESSISSALWVRWRLRIDLRPLRGSGVPAVIVVVHVVAQRASSAVARSLNVLDAQEMFVSVGQPNARLLTVEGVLAEGRPKLKSENLEPERMAAPGSWRILASSV